MEAALFIRKANQQWKIEMAWFLFALLILFIIDIKTNIIYYLIHYYLDVNIRLALGLVLAVLFVLWLRYSIKCPNCRASLGKELWPLSINFKSKGLISKLSNITTCPNCGFNPDDPGGLQRWTKR